jgi:protein-L-isoaspartate(D-aspartate) O-methyltransferase
VNSTSVGPGAGMQKKVFADAQRRSMVERQLKARGIRTPAVLEAMGSVPRHLFVPEHLREYAYEDGPLSIGEGQTISQPYMVALMTECLEPSPADTVLEIGTGSGYQTAVLAAIVSHVYSIERIASLAQRARKVLDELGYRNVTIVVGDGSLGLPGHAPFDGILVTAAAPEVPQPLIEQLATGGRLVIPVGGEYHQTLWKITRQSRGISREEITGCVFVPLIGTHGWKTKDGSLG